MEKENQEENNENQNQKSIWKGFGNFISSVKDKTLKFVDDLQDKITEFDESMEKKAHKPKKEFDPSLLPILENATTYLEEPINNSYPSFLEKFEISSKQKDIELFIENCPNLKRIYSRLVPSSFSEKDFWARLFFKLQLREEAQRVSEELQTSISESANNSTVADELGLSNEEIAELEAMQLDDDDENDWGDWK